MQYMHASANDMHVMSQAKACTYCMGSKVSSLSWMYLYSSYFAPTALWPLAMFGQLLFNVYAVERIYFIALGFAITLSVRDHLHVRFEAILIAFV